MRWNPNGDMIASVHQGSPANPAKLRDFKTGKVLHTSSSVPEDGKLLLTNINELPYIQFLDFPMSICFI